MISGHGTIETAVQATKLGAFDFLEKPLSSEKTMLAVRNALRQNKLERAQAQQAQEYVMVGDLTIRGVTKQVSLDVTLNGPVENPNPNAKNFQIGIKALGKIKRSDFNLGSKLITAFVSDEIQIRVTGEFNKPNPNAK